jgi:hypothetical protein
MIITESDGTLLSLSANFYFWDVQMLDVWNNDGEEVIYYEDVQ